MPRIRCYTELSQISDFEGRYEYLRLNGSVGAATFGFDRYLNQRFYRSREWQIIRNEVIARDDGCDLGIKGREIFYRPYVHHMNPMTEEEIVHGESSILSPEVLITVTHRTHNAIHFGDKSLLARLPAPRRPGDTKLW